MRLAVLYVVRGDHAFGDGQACGPEAGLGQGTSAGSHDGPTIRRQLGEQPRRTWKQDYALEVLYFAALDFSVLGCVVGVRQVFTDRGEAGTAVRAGDDLVGIEIHAQPPSDAIPGRRREWNQSGRRPGRTALPYIGSAACLGCRLQHQGLFQAESQSALGWNPDLLSASEDLAYKSATGPGERSDARALAPAEQAAHQGTES